MTTQSAEQLFTIIDDSSKSSQERTQAVKALSDVSTPEIIERLISLMADDPDAGVRWAAAGALIEADEAALRPLLSALVERHDSTWLREGAYRVFRETHSAKVHDATADLVKGLKGPAAEVNATDLAAQAYMKLL
jgi:HEAT repeat protein